MEVGHIENLAAELQSVPFPRKFPTLGQAHVPTGKSGATQRVPRAALARIGILKVRPGSRRIRESTYRAVRLYERAGLRSANHGSQAGVVPVGGPGLPTANTKWKAAGPPGQAPNLPAADDGVERAASVATEGLPFAEWQVHSPVGIDLMCRIKIRDRAILVW